MSRDRKQKSIRHRLTRIMLLGLLITSALAMGVSSWRHAGRFADDHASHYLRTAEVFAGIVAEPLAAADTAGVYRGLAAISRMPLFTYARVVGANGRLVAELGSGVVLVSRTYLPLPLRSQIQVVADVRTGDRRLGQLMLIADNSGLRIELAENLVVIALTALLSALVGVYAIRRLQDRITAPLVQLAAAMDRIRESQDFSHFVASDGDGDDEVGRLVETFNDLQRHVRQRDRKLARHREELEQTVETRTQELVLARDAAQQANAAKSDFLATMSHEIRTPMNGMLVMAELLASAALTPQNRRYAEVIVKSGHSLLTIINDILDFSKIDAGKLELERVAFDPAALIDDVLALFYERAIGKGLDIAGHVAPEVPAEVIGDPVRLNQVLANLVANALKFTGEGGVLIELRIEGVAREGGTARLTFSVTDTGIGIPADKQAAIFEAFSQADQSTTRRFGGTGLGLAICKRLVGAMGGDIGVDSEVGGGSRFTFHVEMPLAAGVGAAARPLCERLRRALVIDDAMAGGHALGLYLEDHGIEVLPAEAHVTAAAPAAGADLVIAGAEALADIDLMLERQPDGRRPYLVCLAPLGDDGHEGLVRAGVIDDVVGKPVARGEIYALLERLEAGQPRRMMLLDSQPLAPSTGARFSGAHVLVADDSAVNREVAIEALKRLDITCEVVGNGEEAVEAVGRRRFDLVLMDCSMPVMDGFDATRSIRRREAATGAARLPIVALTAHVAGLPAHDWQQVGMDAYLTKPFRLAELTEMLERFLPAAMAEPAAAFTGPAADAADDAGAPAGEANLPVLDETVLAAYAEFAEDGGAALAERLFVLFLEHAPAALRAIERCLAGDDLEALAGAAHALKSMGRNIGAARLCAACERLELDARQGRAIDAVAARGAIAGELARLEEVIAGRRAA